ncbi:MAG: ABC-2 family transporter protein [Planctomycetota bacterium]|jgi:ABC-2 type transport system permease protein|nr:ABC-2 family transporter protein [Planctomycetota bacterium]
MRIGPYLHLMRTAFLKLMAYRMRYVTGIATYAIFVGVQYFIWKAVFAAREMAPGEQLAGLDFPSLVTYIAIGYIARAAYYNNLDSEIAARFQNGQVVMDLLRPLSFHGNFLAQAAGETAFRVLFFALPMSLLIFPLFGVHPPGADGWWQFPLLFLLAFWINAEFNLLVGTCAFFLEDITGLMSLKRNLVMLASGLLVPLHFMRDLLGDTAIKVITALPFALIGYYPVLAYVGQLGIDGTPGFSDALMLGLIWGLGFRCLNLAMWAWAKRRLEIQGG